MNETETADTRFEEVPMEKKILIHGSGHKAASWNEVVSHLENSEDILCPELAALLDGREASYPNLYASFIQYCDEIEGSVHLCGLSLGGILALNYAVDFPEKVKTLVLVGTPHKVPKVMFQIQNVIFRLLPKSVFETMAFDKKNTFALGCSMKDLDFRGRVEKITCPTLILCGEKDRANRKSAYYLSQNIKGAELRILQHTGHVVNEENPRALAKQLTEFYALHTERLG